MLFEFILEIISSLFEGFIQDKAKKGISPSKGIILIIFGVLVVLIIAILIAVFL